MMINDGTLLSRPHPPKASRTSHHTEGLPQLIGRDLFRQIADASVKHCERAQRTYSEAQILRT